MFSYILDFLIGIVFCLFFFTVGIIFVVNVDTIYDKDIDLLKLESAVEMDKTVIKSNYESVISFISPATDSELSIPNIQLSENAVNCIEQVKKLVRLDYILVLAIGLLCCFIVIHKSRIGDAEYLFVSSITTMVLALAGFIGSIFSFKSMFDWFRNFLYGNDSWKLNSNIDRIVLIFPDEFFKHCSLAVFLFIFFCGCGMFFIWSNFKLKSRKQQG